MNTDLVILTHHKCASNWLRGICRELAALGVARTMVKGTRKNETYDSTAADAKLFILNVNATDAAAESLVPSKARNLHFVRDPRDALVSNYFSWRYSHKNNNEVILRFREKSAKLSVEEGMLLLLADFPMGLQLERWTDDMWGQTTLFKYENLLDDFNGALNRMLGAADISLSADLLERVAEATSFRSFSGREQGEEDQTKHFRKGVAGDWENYVTPRLNEAFEEKYGWLVEKLSYR